MQMFLDLQPEIFLKNFVTRGGGGWAEWVLTQRQGFVHFRTQKFWAPKLTPPPQKKVCPTGWVGRWVQTGS